jgi:hypothetical protein
MVSYNDIVSAHGLSSVDVVLDMLGQKMGSGQQLTNSEMMMAMSQVAKQRFDSFGPSPANMQLKRVELPEDVKGVIASYTGV